MFHSKFICIIVSLEYIYSIQKSCVIVTLFVDKTLGNIQNYLINSLNLYCISHIKAVVLFTIGLFN